MEIPTGHSLSRCGNEKVYSDCRHYLRSNTCPVYVWQRIRTNKLFYETECWNYYSQTAGNKTFFLPKLGFTVVFENEFYLLLDSRQGNDQISFLFPNHPTQQRVFNCRLAEAGYLTTSTMWMLCIQIRTRLVCRSKLRYQWRLGNDRHFAI